jgi:hypothetical protein
VRPRFYFAGPPGLSATPRACPDRARFFLERDAAEAIVREVREDEPDLANKAFARRVDRVLDSQAWPPEDVVSLGDVTVV